MLKNEIEDNNFLIYALYFNKKNKKMHRINIKIGIPYKRIFMCIHAEFDNSLRQYFLTHLICEK
nr:hypothetical protein GTC16762_11830 [Pigmentibacter ruber]